MTPMHNFSNVILISDPQALASFCAVFETYSVPKFWFLTFPVEATFLIHLKQVHIKMCQLTICCVVDFGVSQLNVLFVC